MKTRGKVRRSNLNEKLFPAPHSRNYFCFATLLLPNSISPCKHASGTFAAPFSYRTISVSWHSPRHKEPEWIHKRKNDFRPTTEQRHFVLLLCYVLLCFCSDDKQPEWMRIDEPKIPNPMFSFLFVVIRLPGFR